MDFLENLTLEIFNDLHIEVESDEDYSEPLLKAKIKNAIRDIKAKRCYPSYYTEEMIYDDLESLFSKIYNLALYDYNSAGAEGNSRYAENNTSRDFVDRDKYFKGVYPIAKCR